MLAFAQSSIKKCPFKLLEVDNVQYIPQGSKKLYGMWLVTDVLILHINFMPSIQSRYRNGYQNLRKLIDIPVVFIET